MRSTDGAPVINGLNITVLESGSHIYYVQRNSSGMCVWGDLSLATAASNRVAIASLTANLQDVLQRNMHTHGFHGQYTCSFSRPILKLTSLLGRWHSTIACRKFGLLYQFSIPCIPCPVEPHHFQCLLCLLWSCICWKIWLLMYKFDVV